MQSVTYMGTNLKKLVLVGLAALALMATAFFAIQHFTATSGNAEAHRAVLACELSSGSTRAQCECGIRYAMAHGDSATKLVNEFDVKTYNSGALLQDRVIVASAFACIGS